MRPKIHLLTSVLHGRKSYLQKALGIGSANSILYHPMSEAAGGVADDWSPENNDGAYTGVTLGQDGIGDGLTCPLFDGVNDFNNIYSAALNVDFDGAEGTMTLWAKANDWLAAQVLMQLEVNNSNEINFANSPNNNLAYRYIAGGTESSTSSNVTGVTGWAHFAITWSALADKVKAFYNGVQVGPDITGLGVWAGNLHSARCNIGCNDNGGPSQPFDGYLAHGAIWNAPLPDANILALATL